MNSLAKIDRLNFNVDDLNIFPDININKMAMDDGDNKGDGDDSYKEMWENDNKDV